MAFQNPLPMQIRPLKSKLKRYLSQHQLSKKFEKQAEIFAENPRHRSLNTERLEPKHLRIYSFRVDRKYRAIFIFITPEEIEIIDINDHYE